MQHLTTHLLFFLQDPTLIYDVPNYEPYDNLTAIQGAIKWPDTYNAPNEDKDSTNALLGYVSVFGNVRENSIFC